MFNKWNNICIFFSSSIHSIAQVHAQSDTQNNVNCNNININANSANIDIFSELLSNLLTQGQTAEEGGGIEQRWNSDIVFICINNNNNELVVEDSPPLPPPPPPPPQTASLTVNKEIFGCDNIVPLPPFRIDMDCTQLPNNDPNWISCDDPAISDTIFCQALPENIFDIQVLDDEGNLIEEFEGSTQGTTIENLEPGTYTVKEIKHTTPVNQLGENPDFTRHCVNIGFTDGGILVNTNEDVFYNICFEYEDEQGNDCSTTTLAAGEEKTCTVKNYITFGRDNLPV